MGGVLPKNQNLKLLSTTTTTTMVTKIIYGINGSTMALEHHVRLSSIARPWHYAIGYTGLVVILPPQLVSANYALPTGPR
jgi:hypothetical protein